MLVGSDLERVVLGRVQLVQHGLQHGVLRGEGRGEGGPQQENDQVLRRELVQRHRREVAQEEGLGQGTGREDAEAAKFAVRRQSKGQSSRQSSFSGRQDLLRGSSPAAVGNVLRDCFLKLRECRALLSDNNKTYEN